MGFQIKTFRSRAEGHNKASASEDSELTELKKVGWGGGVGWGGNGSSQNHRIPKDLP